MDRASLQARPGGGAAASRRDGILLEERLELWRHVLGRHWPQDATIETPDQAALRLAQPYSVLGQGAEDRLEIERRPADDLEELAGGRLLLERHAQLAVARLQLGEQPHVFNGNDRLVGERLQQIDVAWREWPGLRPLDDDRPDRRAVGPQHRNTEQAAEMGLDRHPGVVLGIVPDVVDRRDR